MTWHKVIASPKKYATETNYGEYDASMQTHFSVRSSHPPTQLVLSSADTALDTGNCTTLGQTLSHRKEGLQWGPWPEGIKDTPVQGHSCPSPCWILSDAATLQISFSSCSSLSFSLPRDSSVNLVHATLHLRFYFQASHPKTKVLWNKILFWNYIMNKMLEKRCAWYISTNYLLNVIPIFPKDTCGSSAIK